MPIGYDLLGSTRHVLWDRFGSPQARVQALCGPLRALFGPLGGPCLGQYSANPHNFGVGIGMGWEGAWVWVWVWVRTEVGYFAVLPFARRYHLIVMRQEGNTVGRRSPQAHPGPLWHSATRQRAPAWLKAATQRYCTQKVSKAYQQSTGQRF